MKSKKYVYPRLYSIRNLIIAWERARKGKGLNEDVIEFEKDLRKNILKLHYELKNKTYKPSPLVNFILRDPKVRKISKSHFRDRIVHHAIINVIGNIFERTFIYDSCANQIKKGTIFALKRFDKFRRKVTRNNTSCAFCLKADIRHYFEEVDHEILMSIIKRRIIDRDLIGLIKKILLNGINKPNYTFSKAKGMPLGNYTSQFFANIYLNPLDYFIKHSLRIKYYVRYVDDFIILHNSKKQLENCKKQIDRLLKERLKLTLHPQKSRIIPLSRGIDFVGFRNYPYHKLPRKRNIISMKRKIALYKENKIDFGTIYDSYKGWRAYAIWANTHKLCEKIKMQIIDILWNKPYPNNCRES